MVGICENCEYIAECKPKQENPNAVACSEFGLIDENGNLIGDREENET